MSSESPALCANNCGFYANKDNKEELCSKCYSELWLKDIVRRHIKEATKLESQSCRLTSSSRLEERLTKPKIDDPEGKSSSFDDTATEKGKKKARCSLCPKVVGLLGFNCRCGRVLCSNHRLPEMHDCHAFNYKAKGKEAIAQQNPKFPDDKGLPMHL